MWPTLVANKILKKRLGSTNFIADYPSYDEPLLGFADIDHSLETIPNHHKENHKYKIFVSTWNIGGIAPEEDLNIHDLLETNNNLCDIYVLGFQEIVPLKASNVLGSENNEISKKWNSIIRKALNKDEKDKVHSESSHDDFQCIISKQMVGIFISVWIRRDIRPFIQHPNVSCIGCGILGCLGNKGSVSVRFQLHETSFCFVCSHLASGGKEGDEKCRNSNVAEIFSRTSFPRGPLFDLPRTILDHELLYVPVSLPQLAEISHYMYRSLSLNTRHFTYSSLSHVVLLGDLNYRISLPEETTRLLVEKKDWDSLLENDQLMMELMNGNNLRGWHEGPIKFAPTYKYCPNSDIYYGCCCHGKKIEKRRAPAWCDRIVWYGKGLKQHEYTRSESRLSDHRPVKAIFTAVIKVSSEFKSIQSLSLSERFEQIKTPFEVSTTDEIICRKQPSFHL